jgi:hypothetical protein
MSDLLANSIENIPLVDLAEDFDSILAMDISHQIMMEQFIFFMHTPNVTPHIECVSVVDKQFAVTYRHLDHQDYKKGQNITIQQLIDPEKEKVNVSFPCVYS